MTAIRSPAGEGERRRVAAELDLPMVRGQVLFPDAKNEYVTVAGAEAVAVVVGSMRCSRYEALTRGGGRELLNSEVITEAIRPCTP